MKKGDDSPISEFGNWNVANDFSKIKIMKPLYLSDEYEDVARYGTSSLIEQILSLNVPTERLRIIGLERLIDALIKLIKNARFAIKRASDKTILDDFEKDLVKLKDRTHLLYDVVRNNIRKTQTYVINEEKFKLVLDKLCLIKSKINEPLNRSHLIFTDREEFDPKKMKENMKKRIIESG